MAIEVLNETTFDIDVQRVMSLGEHLYARLHIAADAELAIVFVDNEAMSYLHHEWMGLEGPTDVMSFSMDGLRPGTDQEPANGLLGDIVISPEVAAEHASTGGHSTADEIALLVIYGLLHLLGYDHHDDVEKQELFSFRKQLLEHFLWHECSQLLD